MALTLKIFRPLWGVVPTLGGQWPLEHALREIKKLGYDGIEVPFKYALLVGKDKFKNLLKENNLQFVSLIITDGPAAPGVAGMCGGPFAGHPKPGPSVADHVAVFQRQIEDTLDLNPVVINSHSGRDHFSLAMGNEFFGRALEIEKKFGIPVGHETHRGRFLYSPWIARDFIANNPQVKLTADFSHWVCVAEAGPDDEELKKAVSAIIPNVLHMHCRVGFEEGPQVVDPRAPEWQGHLQGHERWWDAIWKAQAGMGQKLTTLSPEHGPAYYQHVTPFSQAPLANIWEINHFVAQRRQESFAKLFGFTGTLVDLPKEL